MFFLPSASPKTLTSTAWTKNVAAFTSAYLSGSQISRIAFLVRVVISDSLISSSRIGVLAEAGRSLLAGVLYFRGVLLI